ncbi:winged helix-turn-helix transcriptional regulator [Amphibacillus sediminis]|uniref:winged helix-turn-helix transcriptional regulator n=1 Tax=Amphibacillus sediminis TaxID=360185 RepID=UPI0008325408|nr:helix-turn-helix domain-containing protein [Amphibacillus sediminis]
MEKVISQTGEIVVIDCSIEKALNVLASKWSFLILRELFTGTKRFSQLQRAIHDVSPKSLTNALRHMEDHDILKRKVYPTVPAKVEYTLTEKGQDLHKIIKEMKVWGAKWG